MTWAQKFQITEIILLFFIFKEINSSTWYSTWHWG
jgi:hypothetical protein